MKPTNDPRCPRHPDREVLLSFRPNELPAVWACAICHRTLGVASVIADIFGPMPKFPEGRRPTPWAMALARFDWNWCAQTQKPGSL
jgi:hypothetical protein